MPDQKSETSKLDVFVSKNGGNENILKLENINPNKINLLGFIFGGGAGRRFGFHDSN